MIVWSFGKCAHGGCQQNWRIEKKLTEWVCPWNISYGMEMKEKIGLTGVLLGTNHGSITTNQNQSVLKCNGNIPVHLQPKSLRLRHPLERLYLPCSGILREYWLVHCEKHCENVNSASWQCQTPYTPSNPEENSRTTVGTSWTSALQPGLGH
jgi:hypothetical protein